MLDVETLGVALKLVKEGGGGGGEGAAIIDDSKILTSTTWSSQKIVDTLCPPFTASGSVVQCTPVENSPLDVQVEITPTQEGTGDPSPENVRPIVGMDSVQVTRCGANLLDFSKITFSQGDIDGGLVSIDYAQRKITIAANINNVGYTQSLRDIVGEVPPGTYVFDAEVSSPGAQKILYLIDTSKAVMFGEPILLHDVDLNSSFSWYNSPENPEENTISNIRFSMHAIDYAPYTGTTATLTLPETIYGGTLDVVTGTLTVTQAEIESYNGENLPGQWISDRDIYTPGTQPSIGAQVVYDLAESQTIQLTPQQILALSGTNTVYTDAGDITVTGASDPIATITALQDRVSALESAVLN